jgi:hypothetical protein
MSRIEKLLEYMKTTGKDSFLQHALALEYIKILSPGQIIRAGWRL